MIKDEIKSLLNQVLAEIGACGIAVEITVPENSVHGDYTTNVALRLAGQLKKSPMDIALQVKEALEREKKLFESKHSDHNIYQEHQKESAVIVNNAVLQDIERIEIVPPGFINLFWSEAKLSSELSQLLDLGKSYGTVRKSIGQKIMVEFAHPNTHKAFHIGHLRNITTGEASVRLLEATGHEVIRANYQGDVGMHIAKALYGLLENSEIGPKFQKFYSLSDPASSAGESRSVRKSSRLHSDDKLITERVDLLGQAYAVGSKAFEENEEAKAIIKDINALIYASAQKFAKERGRDPGSIDYLSLVANHRYPVEQIYQLWKATRQWSLDYFDIVYSRVDSKYQRFYFESECLSGVDLSRQAVVQGVLQQSEGAIIFDGKRYGLDTRVFVNNLGLPTYEGKELALAKMETTEFGKLTRIIHVVGPEQASFFQVSFKVEELLGFVPPGVQKHLIYGFVRLKHGKMSSRTGKVILGEWLLDEAKKEVQKILDQSIKKYPKKQQNDIAEKAAIAAVKYAFLKVTTTSDIAFDFAESVNIHGDSGPYLQYTYARCKSVLRKSHLSDLSNLSDLEMNTEERRLARQLIYFPEIVADAAANYAPSTLCTYLFDLAQMFNTFYAKHPILVKVGSQSLAHGQANLRLALTGAVAQVLGNGLYLLGIETVEEM